MKITPLAFLLTLLQFVLFIVVFIVGSFARPFNILTNLDHSNHLAVTHYFIWDGLILMFVLFAVILLVEALRKRLATAALWTTLAVILATVLGLVAKFGFITREF